MVLHCSLKCLHETHFQCYLFDGRISQMLPYRFQRVLENWGQGPRNRQYNFDVKVRSVVIKSVHFTEFHPFFSQISWFTVHFFPQLHFLQISLNIQQIRYTSGTVPRVHPSGMRKGGLTHTVREDGHHFPDDKLLM